MNTAMLVGALGIVVLATACGRSRAAETASSPPPATFAEQVTLGQSLYGEKCASCHGAGGEGGGAPKLVGLSAGALPLDPPSGAKQRKSQFGTVADVAEFVVHAMPPGGAGELTAEQYLAVLAFDLNANGVKLDAKLDMPLAKTLVIPR